MHYSLISGAVNAKGKPELFFRRNVLRWNNWGTSQQALRGICSHPGKFGCLADCDLSQSLALSLAGEGGSGRFWWLLSL